MATCRRPNILLIMSDQHHARRMGCAGDAVMHTPSLDRLAARGVRFSSAYCNFPLCLPSRMSFMTARYPHRIDCLTNSCQLRSDTPTFAHAFGAAGYETVLAGRMHFVGGDQRHGFDTRLVGDVSPTAYINPVTGWQLEEVLGSLVDTPGMSAVALEKSGPGRTGYHAYDETVCRAAVEWLRSRSLDAAPFLLLVGLVSPHSPFVAPPADYARYDGQITVEDLPDLHLDGLHPIHQDLRKRFGLTGDVSPESQRRARAAYLGLCTFTDRLVGTVLDALEQSGLRDDTLVVYTSDHGEQMGEHGLWWKSTFYEGSVAVPLIVAGPGIEPEGSVATQKVSLMDIGPTLLDLAAADPLPGADGRSFRCLLERRPQDWPDTVIAEHVGFAEEGLAQRMIRQGPWKLNHYHDLRPQLFNLQEDPGEQIDRWDDPACLEQMERLQAIVLQGWDPDGIAARMRTRHAEQVLFGHWVKRNRPPEPDPPWFTAPPENRIGPVAETGRGG